jgi:hypothetical protein
MKRLSDYHGDEAIDLWADLLDPISEILTDKEVAEVTRRGDAPINIAKTILKRHKTEAANILLRIDPEPLDGLNIIMRLVSVLVEVGQRDDVKAFFGYAAQENQKNESSTSVTESTEVSEN